MEVKIKDKIYHVTNMFVVGKEDNVPMQFNVFDSDYKFVTSITCEDEVEFMLLFNNYLKEHSYDMV